MNEEDFKNILIEAENLVRDLPELLRVKAFEIVVKELIKSKSVASSINSSSVKKSSLSKLETKVIGDESVKKLKADGLKNTIMDYIKNGFFEKNITPEDLVKEFRKKALTKFSLNAVRVTLFRLVQSNILEREGEGTTKNPWKYKKRVE